MSSAAPRVSILLPVYNAVTTVGRAIASMQNQTFADWELLMIDDGSTDGTADVLQNAARGDARIRVLGRPHEGLVAALNAGLAASRGQFIARMDADDTSHPERLAEQVAWLDRERDLGLAGCLVEFNGNRNASEGYARYVDWINSLCSPSTIALNRFVESPFAHPSVMFRRELIDRHGGYRAGDFPEDYELWLRWIAAGVRMAKVPRVLLTWHDGPARLSRTDLRYDPEKFFATKAKWIARALQAERKPGMAERPVFVWGAGRPTRKRASHLAAQGVNIAGYIDVDVKKVTRAIGGTGAPVIAPGEIPPPGTIFVLGYVSSRGARDLIRTELQARGYVEGSDFLMCA